MKDNYLFAALVVISLIMVFIIGCSEDKITPAVVIPVKNIDLDPNGSYTMDDVYNTYDSNDVMGMIQIKNDYFKTFFWDDPNELINGNYNNGFAYFYDYLTADTLYECDGLSFNNYNFFDANSGSFTYVGYGDQESESGLIINFDNNNTIVIDGNQYIPSVDTTITFGSAIRFLNINRGDTISTQNSLIINWTGESQEYAYLKIFNADSLAEYSDTSLYEGSAIIDNDGSFTVQSNIMSQFRDGLYDISITKFSPYFLPLSNGKKIVLIIESSHTIKVTLLSQ